MQSVASTTHLYCNPSTHCSTSATSGQTSPGDLYIASWSVDDVKVWLAGFRLWVYVCSWLSISRSVSLLLPISILQGQDNWDWLREIQTSQSFRSPEPIWSCLQFLGADTARWRLVLLCQTSDVMTSVFSPLVESTSRAPPLVWHPSWACAQQSSREESSWYVNLCATEYTPAQISIIHSKGEQNTYLVCLWLPERTFFL